MKMTPLLWRVVSLWLFVAVVCWHSACYVTSTETQQEAQRLVSSQDASTEEEPEENTLHLKAEENWVLQSSSEDEQLVDQREKAPTTQEMDKREEKPEAVEAEEPNSEVESGEEKGLLELEPQQGLETQHPEDSISQEQDSASSFGTSPPPSRPVAGFAVKLEDHSTLTFHDDIPISVSENTLSDVPAPVPVSDADLPPADCEEEETNPYDSDSSPPVILENTSNVHAAGTKTHTDPPLSPQSAHSARRLEANASHMLKEHDLSSLGTTETDASMSSKDPEDIPTFDEWKRKVMEVEKEKTHSTHTSTNGGSQTVKKVQKNFNNYASVECGAKILGSNPEAKSTSAILMENMDMYMLNPCSNKIWFVIELCEPIQVKQLDIANFELFSSTPKDFLVFISDRYPTNKWLKLGTFHGRDERTVQSFPLDEHLYAKYVKMFTKYIKVELVSHFGSEHFCPLSLIRVFGTSMVEEYEEITDPSERPDDQDDELDLPGYAPGEVKYSKNLIGSAKDAIFNMVNNIANNVLGGGTEMQGNVSSQEVNITESSPQLEVTTLTTTTRFVSVADSEEVEIPLDPETPAATTPSPETPVPEIPAADTDRVERPPVDEKIVIPLQKDEEEPISSTITLLDKEEELDEEREIKEHIGRQQESLDYCELSTSLQLFCCCSASLQEHLQRQCSVRLSKRRKCHSVDGEQTVPSHIQTSMLQLPLSPSASPEAHGETHRLQEKEQAPEEDESEVDPLKFPHLTGNAMEPQEEAVSEFPALEPSQTTNLLKPSATDFPSAKPTQNVDLPPLSSEEPPKELTSLKSQNTMVEEKHKEPSAALSSPSSTKSSVSATTVDASEEKHRADVPVQTPDVTDQSQALQTSIVPNLEHPPTPPATPENATAATEVSHSAPDTAAELEPSGGHAVITESKLEGSMEDNDTSSSGNTRPTSPSSSSSLPSLQAHSDFYAELPGGIEQNGNQVHSSSQKESVFMRLNNRIKALEMNMSLSGRYLEQLSQRYRKQMEEMQKAFNKTIIKLQNTSRIAAEQDQRQTESIQSLQGHLQNVTQLVLNLSVQVGQLQTEVSDRQSYLLLSLMLCVFLGLLLCANHCGISTSPPKTEPEPPTLKRYSYCCPERQFTSCDEGMKRSASYPLIHSESFQLDTNEDPEILQTEDTQNLSPANRKKRRRKVKAGEKVETLKPSFQGAPALSNGVVSNGAPVAANPNTFTKRFLQPDSEGSSEGSSHSDDPFFCGITAACTRICEGLPPPKTKAEKRALKRRHPKPSCVVVDLPQASQRDKTKSSISTVQELMSRKMEQSSGTFGVNVSLSGHV
ncbi:hypothetical protein LDENG_00071440 [Lucifuga dentata]|nr:hypothetical protein LDENG_00071440 [Lucifuga dentata]